MTRLLVLTENYRAGGGNRWVIDLANALGPHFDELVLAANEGGYSEEDLARLQLPARVVTAPVFTVAGLRERGWPKWVRGLARLAEPVLAAATRASASRILAHEAPDLVIACVGGYPAARAPLSWVIAAHRLGVPAVLSVVGTPAPRPGGLLGPYERLVEQRLDAAVFSAASFVLANAQSILSRLTELRGMPVGAGECVHNGLEDSAFRVSHHANGEVRIGLVSRIDTDKGVFVLLEAFEGLSRGEPPARLSIVGSGPELGRLRDEVVRRGLAALVDAPGRLEEDVAQTVSEFDVYAMPSFHEGFPYSMIEAMRAGCAIVITAVGGIPEVLVDGENALLVPPGDPAALSEALRRVVHGADLRARLGMAARQAYERECTMEAMERNLVAAFRRRGFLGSDTPDGGNHPRTR